MIELNRGYNADFMEISAQLPDKSVGLIMADPPYFEVKGDFDFIWSSFDDYLKDVERWAAECKRILADNGSLFWWGHAKKIAYSQIVLDKYFNLGNSLVWEKIECQTKAQDYDQSRHFAPVTERCLFYTNEIETTGLQSIKSDENLFLPIKEYLRNEKNKTGLTLTDLNEILVNKRQSDCIAKRYFGTSLWELPTKEMYLKLQSTGFFKKEFSVLRNEYDNLRIEYENIIKKYESERRPFNNNQKLNDVIKNSQEGQVSGQYDHDTIKPLGLIKKLLQTTTRPDTLVFIPFWGSGTDSEACHEFGLDWIACEIDEKHYNTATKRQKEKEKQPLLF